MIRTRSGSWKAAVEVLAEVGNDFFLDAALQKHKHQAQSGLDPDFVFPHRDRSVHAGPFEMDVIAVPFVFDVEFLRQVRGQAVRGRLCFAAAQALGGSGFIAAFVGGLLFGKLAGEVKDKYLEATENTGDVFALLTWVAFGAAVGLSATTLVVAQRRPTLFGLSHNATGSVVAGRNGDDDVIESITTKKPANWRRRPTPPGLS